MRKKLLKETLRPMLQKTVKNKNSADILRLIRILKIAITPCKSLTYLS